MTTEFTMPMLGEVMEEGRIVAWHKQVGDRVEFPGLGIEGEVVDIALSVVKIKSGDNTVYSMPTYNLVSLPFKIMLFVLADGWNLLSASLVATFQM